MALLQQSATVHIHATAAQCRGILSYDTVAHLTVCHHIHTAAVAVVIGMSAVGLFGHSSVGGIAFLDCESVDGSFIGKSYGTVSCVET